MAGTISGNPTFSTGAVIAAGQVITTDTVNNTTSNAGVAIQGKSGSGSAATGYVGEIISTTWNAVSVTSSGSFQSQGSITLSAGAWDIRGAMFVQTGGAGTTFTANSNSALAVTTTSGSSSGAVGGLSEIVFQAAAVTGSSNLTGGFACIPGFRVNISGSTTYYANVSTTYGSTNPTTSGNIAATRVF